MSTTINDTDIYNIPTAPTIDDNIVPSIEEATDSDIADNNTSTAVFNIDQNGNFTYSTGDIETPYDKDWIKVNLDSNENYIIELKGSGSSVGTLSDTYLSGIYDSEGTYISGTTNDDGGNGMESKLEWSPTISGDYFISAGAYGGETGTYQLSVTKTINPFTSDSTPTLTISNDETTEDNDSMTISSEDEKDYYKVSLVAGNEYKFTANSNTTSAWMDINLFDADGNQIYTGVENPYISGIDKVTQFVPTTTGDYFLEVRGTTDSYSLTTQNLGELDKYGDTISEATTLTLVDDIADINDGQIHNSYDYDYFKLTVTDDDIGRDYLLQTNSDNQWGWMNIDIYNASGDQIWDYNTICCASVDEEKIFTPTTAGYYYLRLDGSSGYDYTFHVEKLANPLETAEVLTIQESGMSSIGTTIVDDNTDSFNIASSNDEDYYKVSLIAGNQYKFQADSNSDSWTWMDIDILDANGNEITNGITTNWVSGVDKEIIFTAERQIDSISTPPIAGNNAETSVDQQYYYLRVSGSDGTYTISTQNMGLMDKYGDTREDATALTLTTDDNGVTSATIDDAKIHDWNDYDYFSLVVEDGYSYTLSADMNSSSWTWMDIDIYDTNGNRIWDYDTEYPSGIDEQIVFTPTQAGTYYFRLDGTSGDDANYTFTVTDNGIIDYHGDTRDTATELSFAENETIVSVGETEDAPATLHNWNDYDYFSIETTAGQEYLLKANSASTWGWMDIDIYGANGNSVWDYTTNWNSTVDKEKTFTADGGIYYFRIDGSSGSGTEYNYTFSVEKLANPLDSASSLSIGNNEFALNNTDTNISDYNDEDYFKLENLVEGHQYIIQADSKSTSSWMDIDILDATGDVIWDGVDTNWISGIDEQKSFTPVENGTYYLRIDGSTGDYTLNVKDAGEVDIHGNSISDATSLSLDTNTVSIDGQLHNWNDVDYFALSVEANETYVLKANMIHHSSAWMDIDIYDDSGNRVWDYETNYNSSNNEEIIFTPTTAGTYYFAVDGDSGSDYNYTFSIDKLSDDGKENVNTEMLITLDNNGAGSTTGNIETSYDEDWIKVTLDGSKSYTIDLKGSGSEAGTLGDTYLRGIYDSDGNFIDDTTNDDGGNGVESQLEFNPSETGTYYISAGAYGSETGTYTLSVTADIDPLTIAETLAISDNIKTETTITANSNRDTITNDDSFTISDDNDEDYFAVSLVAGNQYIFKADSQSSDWSWMELDILDSDGNQIWDGVNTNWNSSSDREVSFIATTTGTHYLKVDGSTGNYTISTQNNGIVDKYGDDIEHAAALTLTNKTVTVSDGQLHDWNDCDYFSLVVEDGYSYTLSANSQSSSSWTWMDIDIYDTNGNSVYDYETNWNSSVDEEKTFTPTEAGTYYFRINGTSGSDSDYTFTITDNDVVDLYGDDIEHAKVLTLNDDGAVSVTDAKVHNYSDKDYFAVTLVAGESYKVTANSNDAEWTWLDINVRDASNNIVWDGIEENWNSSVDEEITFAPSADGTYYFEVLGSSPQDYSFDIETLVIANDSISEDRTTTASMRIADIDGINTTSYSGNIETDGDEDWVAITLNSSKNYLIELKGMASNAGTLGDTYLRGIYDSDGNFIDDTTNDDGGRGAESQLEFNPSATGTYYISAGAYGSETGTYTLSVTEIANPLDSAESLEINTTETTISATTANNTDSFTISDYNDEDYFAVTLTAGNQYTFKADSQSSDWSWMELDILDSHGNQIWDGVNANWNSSSDREISFVATTTGTHYLKVDGSTGNYTISTQDNGIVDKYGDDTAHATALTLTNNEVTVTDGQLHNWNDVDYFSLNIDANYEYTFKLDSADAWWMDLDIYDANGDQQFWSNGVEENWSSSVDEEITFTTQNAGTYYVKVDGDEGDYTLEITKDTVAADDHSDYANELATDLTVGNASLNGRINESYDNDYFEVTLNADTRYEIIVDSTDLVSNDWGYSYADFGVDIYDTNSNWLGWDNGVRTDWNYDNGVKKTFEVATTGTYYIDVAGYYSEGDYTISVVESSVVDPEGSTTTTSSNALTINNDTTTATADGIVNYMGDEDWFGVTLEANSTYEFTINSNSMDWSYLDIMDSTGNYVWDNVYYDWDWATNSTTITFTTTSDTSYFLSVGGDEGTYTLSATKQIIETDSDNDIASATLISLDNNGDAITTTTDILTRNDNDYFKVDLESGESYNINMLTSMTDGIDYGGYFDIVDSAGNYITEGISWNWSDSSIDFTPASTNTYYIKVASWGTTGNYQLQIDKEARDSIGNSTVSYGDFATLDADNNHTITSELETYSDTDWFKVDGTSGNIYTITLDSADMSWPYLNVYDKDGNAIWDNISWDWSASEDDKVYFTATSDDDFFVEVAGWETGTYDLTITSAANPDSEGSTVSSASVFASIDASDSSVNNHIIAGRLDSNYDQDWFKVTAVSGTTYEVTLDSTTMDNIYVDMLDSNGNYIWSGITWDWSAIEDSKISFTASTDGDYFVQVSGWNETGDYTLEFKEEVNPDTVGNSITEYGVFATLDNDTSNGTANDDIVSGTLDTTTDSDWYSYTMTAGNTYEITLDSETMSYPYLDILDSTGNYIWENIIWDWTASEDNKIYFTPDETANYFISVDGFETGDFTLQVKDVTVSDDYGSSVQTYGTFAAIDAADSTANDNIITGDLETAFDTDWFKISTIAGTTYEVTLDSATMSYPYLDILDSDGNYLWDGIAWDWNSSADDKLYFTASETTDYFISVGGRNSTENGANDGVYTLEFSRSSIADDFGSSIDANITPAVGEITADDITDGTLISGNLGTSFDSDWFRIGATANNTYAIELDSETMNNIYLNIIDNNGDYIWSGTSYDYTATVDSKMFFTASDTADYYISVDGWDTGDYTLKVTNETIIDDYTATVDTTAVVTVGSFTEGTIETYDDADWIKVVLEENKTYQIDLEALNAYVPDTIIYGLYDSEGNYIANTYDDDGGTGLNSQLIYNSTAAGTYYISTTAYSGIGDYKVSVNELIITDNISDDLSTIAVAEVGTTYSGEVDFVYDNDWIKVNLIAGNTYEFTLAGVTLDDTYINGIYDSTGSLIANTSNDDASWYTLDSYIEITPSNSGNYYISVGGYGDEVGTYTLDIAPQLENQQEVLTDSSDTDINNTTTNAIDGILSTYIDGIIDYEGDTDWYSYTFEAGKEYEINLYGSATDSGTLSDTYIRGIYDANGELIANTADNDSGIGRNSVVNFTAQTDGEYYVSAGAYGDDIGTYEINVRENIVQATQEVVSLGNTVEEGDGSWTIMVYLAADNNLEAMALDDINEMELANLPDNVNVTFLIDRADGYSTAEGDWTDTRRGIISHDDDMYSIGSTMESIGEQNTGDGQTLTDFIDWSVDTASADNYGLVIWNHGGGISGVAWDDTSGYDNLTINEVTQSIEGSVLSDSDDGSSHELGMLGFDTCLSGVVDMSYAMKDVADIVVASEALEPGDGWDYTAWFNSLVDGTDDNNTLDSTEVATSAVTSFGEFYDDYYYGTTLSAVDTDLIDEVVDAFGTLNTALDEITQADQLGITNELRDVATFGSYMDIGSLANAIDNVNIGGTASDSSGNTVDSYAQALSEAVDNAVIAQASTVEGTTGISTYYPGFDDQNYLDTFEVANLAHMDQLYDVLSA
jgi:hypothetical protein